MTKDAGEVAISNLRFTEPADGVGGSGRSIWTLTGLLLTGRRPETCIEDSIKACIGITSSQLTNSRHR